MKAALSELDKRAGIEHDEFPIDKFHHEISKQIPSAYEIATLAAMLASGRDINPNNASLFSNHALALFQKCEESRKKEIDRLALYARARAIQTARDALPKPKFFPANLDEVLRLLMPKKRLEDRLKCYRDYAKNVIERRKLTTGGQGENPDKSTDQEAAEWIEHDKQMGLQRGYYDFMSDQFQKWLPKYEAENRRRKGLLGAEGLKKKRQKNA